GSRENEAGRRQRYDRTAGCKSGGGGCVGCGAAFGAALNIVLGTAAKTRADGEFQRRRSRYVSSAGQKYAFRVRADDGNLQSAGWRRFIQRDTGGDLKMFSDGHVRRSEARSARKNGEGKKRGQKAG